ncbi:MAG: hypothetical protein EBS05_12000 [Proteobacteria bacterium]|nr:hypothetical protein [Pseudomonadota bacterium]
MIGAVISFCACAGAPVTVAPVGPPARLGTSRGSGQLIVYSATEEKEVGKMSPYYLRTEYVINRPDGKLFKWVPNHTGNMDQTTQVVALPAGNYEVVALSESYGRVHVPIVIKGGQTTEVDLEGRWAKRGHATSEAPVVRLPNGQVIGWSASPAETGFKQ